MRIIIGASTPQNIGYYPKQQFGDATLTTMWAERILDLKTNGDFLPNVAESYQYSPDMKTITIQLRKDVKYQDNTPLTAESVAWSMREAKAAGTMPNGKRIERIEATEPYTLKVYLNVPNNQVIYNLARIYLFSPTAFNKNGQDWAINNSVSSQGFQVTEFKRDVTVKMKKFPGYWRAGYPYLDSAELITVKDATTASAMMQAKQADMWISVPAQQASELKDKGFKINTCYTTYSNLYSDSTNPASPFAKKQVREALEYAIDRPAMAKALGFGFQIPVFQPTHEGTAAYNPNYPVRAYNPDKAKQLLKDAGYANGIKTKMIVMQGGENAAAVVQEFLAKVGITAEIDVADVGRFWGSINGGWQGLLIGPSAVNPEFCVAFLDHFGPEPIMKFASMAKSKEYLNICEQLVVAPDIATMRKKTQELITQTGLDAMFVPMTLTVGACVMQTNVNSNYYLDLDWTYCSLWDDWISK